MTNLDDVSGRKATLLKAAALADLLEMAEERLSLGHTDHAEYVEYEKAAIEGLWEVYASLVEAARTA